MRFTDFVRDENGWKTESSETHFANDHLAVATEVVKTPAGEKPRRWTVVYRKAAVVIAAQTRAQEFLLVRQERVPIHSAIWEMPAGQIDNNSSPNQKEMERVALKELHEETGYDLADDGEMISLGYFFSSPGFTDEQCYFFLARPVERASRHNREEGESILECRAVAPAELRDMIVENEIRDANTLAICARLAARGFLSLAPNESKPNS